MKLYFKDGVTIATTVMILILIGYIAFLYPDTKTDAALGAEKPYTACVRPCCMLFRRNP